jgi:PBP1b-binding outer membrane lipoprotein LpoB
MKIKMKMKIIKYIIIICLFLNGCTTYKQNQLEKIDYKKATIMVKYIVFSHEKDTIKQ